MKKPVARVGRCTSLTATLTQERLPGRWRRISTSPGHSMKDGLISQRTRDALAAKRSRAERLGAALRLHIAVTEMILKERRLGRTFQAIANTLMRDGVRISRGKSIWYPATVKAVVESNNAARLGDADEGRDQT